MWKFLTTLLIISTVLFASIASAQDSLRLLATMMGEEEWDDFTHCASAGDVNADGFMDIIVGAPGGEGGKGYIKIYFGSPDFDTVPEFRIVDEGNFGASVACAGDVNNDGYDDIIVGAPSAYNPNNGAEWAGKAHIYFGGSPVDTVVDMILQDSDFNDFYGFSLASAGDINGDNYDDVMVAATGGWSPAGRVYIYLGGEEMDSIYDVCIHGDSKSAEELGRSIAGIGDINGDEYDDILIGSPYTGNPNNPGKAEIYLGGNPIDTIPDIAFYGDSIEFRDFGKVVASAGDVNGDGIEDILVGGKGGYPMCARLFSTRTENKNVIFDTLNLCAVDIMPSAFGLSLSSTGDVNGDGFGDFMIGDYQDGVELKGKVYIFYGGEDIDSLWDVTLVGPNGNEGSFGTNVALAGDINGDSYDEIMISSHFDGTHTGEVFIFTSAPTSVNESNEKGQLNNFHLNQNYPNPFNPETIIEYVLPENSQVKLSIYNILGQHIKTLIDEYQKAGYKKITWDGKDKTGRQVSSGVYFYKIKADDFTSSKKMLLLK